MFIMRDARLNTLKFFAKPFAKGYGWGGDLNLEDIFEMVGFWL